VKPSTNRHLSAAAPPFGSLCYAIPTTFNRSVKLFESFLPHVIRFSGGLTINGSAQYPARFFYANHETFDFVFHSGLLSWDMNALLIKRKCFIIPD
jgi:hypothetical protein